MKTIRIILAALLLTACSVSAQAPSSFIWQGNTFTNPKFQVLPGGAEVEVSGAGNGGRKARVPFDRLPPAVQQSLAADRSVKAKGGELLRGLVFQITPDGVLVDPSFSTAYSNGSRIDGTQAPVLLRGYPNPQAAIEKYISVQATPEGQYQYVARNGANRVIIAGRFLSEDEPPRTRDYGFNPTFGATAGHATPPSGATAPAFGATNRAPSTPLPFTPGSKMQGSALDRR